MKLTVEELTFIDTFLQKSEVRFKDIRIELTDHIAEAVEAKMAANNHPFYDAFKDYMAVNKRDLINQKSFSRTARQIAFGFFKSVLFQPTTIFFAIAAYVLVQLIFGQFEIGTLEMLWISNGTLASVAILQLLQFRKNKRFSGVETLSYGLTVIYNFAFLVLVTIETFIEKFWAINRILQIHGVLFFTTVMVYILAEYKLRKLYSKRFSHEIAA